MAALPITIPRAFSERTIAREGPNGERWIAELPAIVSGLLTDWGLSLAGAQYSGTVGVVWEVTSADATPFMLKVGWLDTWSRDEGAALALWNGDGAARLARHDENSGALLLEKLDARSSLNRLPIERALAEAVAVLERLQRPVDAGFEDVVAVENGAEPPTAKYARLLATSRRELLAAVENEPRYLLHGDFHYENVLEAVGSWKAIDPKPMRGPREYDYLPLLRNRFAELAREPELTAAIRHRLDTIVERAGTNSELSYLLAHHRALSDADYAHRSADSSFEQLSLALADATR